MLPSCCACVGEKFWAEVCCESGVISLMTSNHPRLAAPILLPLLQSTLIRSGSKLTCVTKPAPSMPPSAVCFTKSPTFTDHLQVSGVDSGRGLLWPKHGDPGFPQWFVWTRECPHARHQASTQMVCFFVSYQITDFHCFLHFLNTF